MKKIFYFSLFVFILTFNLAKANIIDSDNDGVNDKDEIEIYKTDPNNPDTDGDGYSDWIELNNGYSPLAPNKKLTENDFDNDGLSDKDELLFHTEIDNPDTDGDGYSDGTEIKNGYDPLNKEARKLEKLIKINLKEQKLTYFLGGVRRGEFIISSGVNNTTPKGVFKIDRKIKKAWSNFGLWMPYWMSFYKGKYGIHELPIWPNGRREGVNHLGKPASHGCVRLGTEDAKTLYNWTEIGTIVIIH